MSDILKTFPRCARLFVKNLQRNNEWCIENKFRAARA